LRTCAGSLSPVRSRGMRAQEFEREMWLRADPSSASVARAFVDEATRELGCDRAAAEAFRLGITEAVANAVEHGAPCENGLISVSAYLEAGCLTTEIRDCGYFQVARQQPTNGLEERGRGLPLMFAVMDYVEIDAIPGRTAVRLAKRLPS
jgi:anti-sigma regulatory factor (Ser/Thr protein kinase)